MRGAGCEELDPGYRVDKGMPEILTKKYGLRFTKRVLLQQGELDEVKSAPAEKSLAASCELRTIGSIQKVTSDKSKSAQIPLSWSS